MGIQCIAHWILINLKQNPELNVNFLRLRCSIMNLPSYLTLIYSIKVKGPQILGEVTENYP